MMMSIIDDRSQVRLGEDAQEVTGAPRER